MCALIQISKKLSENPFVVEMFCGNGCEAVLVIPSFKRFSLSSSGRNLKSNVER